MKALLIALLLVTGMVNAQIVNIPDPNFKAFLINEGFDTNADGEIQVSEGLNITSFEINNNSSITSIEGTSSFTNMTSINIFDVPQLTGIDLSNLPNLYGISLQNLPAVTSLNVSGCTGLHTLNILGGIPNIASLNLNGLSGLNTLEINDPLDLSPQMQLTSLNLNGCAALKTLSICNSTLAVLDVSPCPLLEIFGYSDNYVPDLDLSGLTHLQIIRASSNTTSSTLHSINANGCIALNELTVNYNDQLQSVYMKNGRNETFSFSDCVNLAFICADESQLASIQTQLNNASLASTVVNSYCSFTPGGNYNTINGSLTFDVNNNGCDAGDVIQPNIKVKLIDPITVTELGATFSNSTGNYTFYTGSGAFDLLPDMENASWFTFSPNPGNAVFADNNNNVIAQNFCMTANGPHPDLEIVIEPISMARPGFDAVYKIVYKNKGNQTISQLNGIVFSFNSNQMSFVSASQTPSTTAPGVMIWDYANLLPFESRSIIVTMNVNQPTGSDAVNIGDVLSFTTTVFPSDENTADNTFHYNQTVLGSYDPNEIICLEGDLVSPDQIGNYLHYAVGFENTGNFPAENVVVRIDVDATKYDISSLQLLDTSNPSYTRITGNVVEFIFENINLSPRSGNPPVGGHGDVLFKIKSKNTLVSGDHVSKSGKIFFDYNVPITTNLAQTTFQNLSTIIHQLDNSIRIYPNPTNSIITINSNSSIESIELYDIQGRILETHFENASSSTFDISNKSNGIYFLKIKTEKGSKVEKIIKE